MGSECCGTHFTMCCEAYRGVKFARVCNEDCRKGAREETAGYGESGRDVILVLCQANKQWVQCSF